MKIGKFFHSNKGFFLLALVAAVFGLIASFFFSGCTKKEEPSRVIVSTRVKIDASEIVPMPETLPAKTSKAQKSTAKVARETKNSPARKSAQRTKTASIKKSGSAVKTPRHVKERPPLKTLRNSWVINVASFTRTSDAKRLHNRLTSAGYNTYITQFRKGGILYYRVRVGFYSTKDIAKQKGRAISSSIRNIGAPWVAKPGMDEILSHSK